MMKGNKGINLIRGLTARSVLLLVIGLVALTGFAVAQGNDVVLARGNPPLTQSIVDRTIELLSWVLEIDISSEHKTKLQNVLVRAWQTQNEDEIKSTLGMIDIHHELEQMSPSQRNARRPALQAAVLDNLRRETKDEMSQILVAAYESAHSKSVGSSNAGPAPVKKGNRVGSDGFTGVYRMLRPRAISINSTHPESGYWIEYITFLPNGYVYWSLPPEGLLYFDAALTARWDPDDWGTYTITNGEIHVLRGPSKKLYVITRSGDRLNNPPSLGKGTFRPIPSADGLRLEGNYRRSASEPTLTFTADGKFRDGGAFRNFGTLVRVDGSHYQDDGVPGSGTYTIEQNTLELRYSDGRIKRHPFIVFPENLTKRPAVDSFILRREERFERY